jgi:hypothetical protein
MLILKPPPEIPENDLFHAHNIHFTTYSINNHSLVMPRVIVTSLSGERGIILFLQESKSPLQQISPFTRQEDLSLGETTFNRHLAITLPTMGKYNMKAPDFKVTIPYI